MWPDRVSDDAVRHCREDVGLVGQQDDGRIVGDLGQRAGQVVDTFEHAPRALAPGDEGDLVAEAGEPEGVAVLADAGGVVLVDRDADTLQGAATEHRTLAGALRLEIVPPVVIAEHGMHAKRRLELAQSLGPCLGRDGECLELVAGGEIAEQHDDVGLQLVGALGNRGDALRRHDRPAGMHVGDHADLEVEAARPVARRDAIARDGEAPHRLHGKAVAGQAEESSARCADGLQEPAAGYASFQGCRAPKIAVQRLFAGPACGGPRDSRR